MPSSPLDSCIAQHPKRVRLSSRAEWGSSAPAANTRLSAKRAWPRNIASIKDARHQARGRGELASMAAPDRQMWEDTAGSHKYTPPMRILGIETSCDDTSAAIVEDGRILANIVAAQDIHVEYGGVGPHAASRAPTTPPP